MSAQPTVFIVDDEPAVRDSLCLLVKSMGLLVETFASGQEFLDAYDPSRAGCLVVNVRLPGMSGLELHDRLAQQGCHIPVIVITGHADVPMAVRAMKAKVFEFLEKPFNDQVMLESIQMALKEEASLRKKQAQKSEFKARLILLTPREREVMNLIVTGKPNKVLSDELGISRKTFDIHRVRIMAKMQAESLVDLVKMIILADQPLLE